jgi:4-amino-4-deoxy-L-arabinose transferase-like glycosyltransferase
VQTALLNARASHPGPLGKQRPANWPQALKFAAIIAALTFILRIAYAGYLYEDEGMWFTAAEEVLRGKALYGEVYFDKPPGLPLLYALLFWIFGAHIIVIRLFTIAYSLAISTALYFFGARLYDRRVGVLAAAMFAVFSTTYTTGHTQSLSTDLLMTLPYTLGAYLLVRSCQMSFTHRDQSASKWFALAGGAMVGLAFQINPKAIFDLIFFAALSVRPSRKGALRHCVRLMALSAVGFAAAALPFLAYIAAKHSLWNYWLYVWVWGARYGSYYPAQYVILNALTRSADYFALNNTLAITLIFVAASLRKRAKIPSVAACYTYKESASEANSTHNSLFNADAILLIWCAISYAGLAIGGRFFSHYFFQILPGLCLIGARGLIGMSSAIKPLSTPMRTTVIVLLAAGFAFTLVRFHARGALLLADLIGRKLNAQQRITLKWYHAVRNREERLAAATVRDIADAVDVIDRIGLEEIRASGPRLRPAQGPSDYLFVWGYRPEIYYWSGLLPASRYLSTQPLTGVPADVHYVNGERRSLLSEEQTAAARAQLIRDLEQTRPKYIIDELGMFNAELTIESYPELREFMKSYKSIAATAQFMIYRRRDLSPKRRPNQTLTNP